MIKRAFAAWVLLAVLMVVNGLARELVYGFAMPDYSAQVVSTISGIVVLFIVTYFFVRDEGVTRDADAWKVGVVWVLATIAFEFALGYALGRGMPQMLAAYDIRDGGVWPVFLLAEMAAPAFWVQHFRNKAARANARVHFPLIRLN